MWGMGFLVALSVGEREGEGKGRRLGWMDDWGRLCS